MELDLLREKIPKTLYSPILGISLHKKDRGVVTPAQSFIPFPSKICCIYFSTLDSLVLDCLAPEK